MLGKGKKLQPRVSVLCVVKVAAGNVSVVLRGRQCLESSKEIVFMTLHIGSGGDLHVESSSSLIRITVRALERVTGLFVFTLTRARVLGQGQEIAAASARALCCERCSWKCVRGVPGAAVFGILEGNCVYGVTHWVWG